MKKIAIISIFWLALANHAQANIPDGYSNFCSTVGDFFNDWLSIDSTDGHLMLNSRLAGPSHHIDSDFLGLNHDRYSIELAITVNDCELTGESSAEFICETDSAAIKFRNRDEEISQTINKVLIQQKVISKREVRLDILEKNSNQPFITIKTHTCNSAQKRNDLARTLIDTLQ